MSKMNHKMRRPRWVIRMSLMLVCLLLAACNAGGSDGSSSGSGSASGIQSGSGSGSGSGSASDVQGDVSPEDNAAGLTSLSVTNEAGDVLSVGMSTEEFEAYCGFPVEDGWSTLDAGHAVLVASRDRMIAAISVSAGDWTVTGADAVCVGDSVGDVTAALGEPLTANVPDPEDNPVVYNTTYAVGDTRLVLSCDADGVIQTFTLRTGAEITSSLGTIFYAAVGTGNYTVDNISPTIGILDVTHTGEDSFEMAAIDLSGAKEVLVSADGDYAGLLLVPDYTYSLEITTEGSWSLRVLLPTPDTSPEAASFSGSGDYLTAVCSLGDGTWNVEYEGDGPFQVIWYGNSAYYGRNGTVLVDTEGPFSGEVTLEPSDDPGAPTSSVGFFEIRAAGDWSIQD